MTNKLNILDWIALILVIIGGLNWGLVGALSVNVVAVVFGIGTLLSQIIYILVGLSAIYLLVVSGKLCKKSSMPGV